MRRHSVCFLTLAAFCITPALAGVLISGRVVDENKIPLSGVRVSVEAPSDTPSAKRAIQAEASDAAGLFHLEIPAEGLFQVTASREGFLLFHMRDLKLERNSALEIQMNHVRELAESVDVRYSPPSIDPDETSTVRRLDGQAILNTPVPASQDFRNSLPLIPGVVQDNTGQTHFNGGNAVSTKYRLNGFDISDPVSRELTTRLNVDAIQEMEWDANGFSSGKGEGSAGTLEIRTQMGDDRWRFGGTNFVPGVGAQDGVYLNHWSPRIMFSGPIRKGRGWFHNAFDMYYVADTVSDLPKGQNRANSLAGSNLTRFQWNIRENQILTGSYLINLSDARKIGLSVLTPEEATINRRQNLQVATVKDQFLMGGGLLEVGLAVTTGYFRASPQGSNSYVITPFGASGNFFRDETLHSNRQEWLVNEYLKPLQWHGTHQIAVGVNGERSSLDQLLYRRDVAVVRVDGSLVRDVHFLGPPNRTATMLEAYGYAMDKWNPISSLTIEGGLRMQWNEYAGAVPPAPGVAAAWTPGKLGGTKFSAGWGVFYDPLTLRTLAQSHEQTSISTFYSPAGMPLGIPVTSAFVVRPGDLRLARYAVSSFSVERRLPGNVNGRVNLTSREGSRGLAFNPFRTDPSYLGFELENIARQRYRAAEFSFRKTFLAKYQWFAGYTRSAASSNAVVAYSIENPLLSPQAGGPLAWDAPNRAIAWSWMPIEKSWFPGFLRPIVGETDFQILGDYRSGFPFTVTNEAGSLVGKPNGYRFPAYFTLNLALERKFPFRGYIWAFRAGLINAMNRQNPNVVNSDYDSPEFMTFGRGQARAVNVRLRFVGRK